MSGFRVLRSAVHIALALALAAVVVPPGVSAGPGAGVNLAQIEINGRLLPGGVYNLPTLVVTNTGDAPGSYSMSITHVSDQQALRPREEWFDFEPREFWLAPGQAQEIGVRLAPSSKATPGDYFAFLEAAAAPEGSSVKVAVAAATKLSFSVKPASWLDAQRLRISRFVNDNGFLVYAALVVLIAWFGVALFRRLGLRIRFERR